jgi:hypothetical protein
VTSDPGSRDPFQPGPPEARPDDVTAAHPVPPAPSPAAAAPSGWAAPTGPVAGSDPFDRPLDRPVAAVPVQAPVVRSRGGGGMLLNVLLGIALVVAVGGVAFAVGRATAPASTASARTGFGGGGFQGGPNASGAPGGGFGGGAGFGAAGVSIQGMVTAVSATSITIQTTGGQTVTIPIDAQTTYAQRTPSTASAVTSGSTVVVQVQGGGRGAFGNGNGNGNGQGTGPNASGAPGRALGPASTITVIPPAS